MIRREGDRILIDGPVTLANVGAVLADGLLQLDEDRLTVDLAGVTELDSSLLAALLAWSRAAQARGNSLAFANLPEGLQTLARLYGVEPLLGVPARS